MWGLRCLNEYVTLGLAHWFWTKTASYPFETADAANIFALEKLPNSWEVQAVPQPPVEPRPERRPMFGVQRADGQWLAGSGSDWSFSPGSCYPFKTYGLAQGFGEGIATGLTDQEVRVVPEPRAELVK